MNRFDILIPAAPKDFHKLPYLIDSIRKNIAMWRDLHLVVPDKNAVQVSIRNLFTAVHNEQDVLSLDKTRFPYRPTWIYQQFLKLFQNVTSDSYLTIDSDVVFLRPLRMYTDAKQPKPIWWRGWEQNNRPYYEFQERVFNLSRDFPGTFLCDMNFFDRRIIHELMDRNNYTVESLARKTAEIISPTCYPSEADIYMQYVWAYHSGMYEIRQAKVYAKGRHIQSITDQAWPDLEEEIERVSKEDFDIAMFHSWYSK